MGLVDVFRMLNKEDQVYTFWSYRQNMFAKNKGWRIDFFLTTSDIAEQVKKCWTDMEFRTTEKPSDHVPLILEL
jgi:exodeoxyribonuclease-3